MKTPLNLVLLLALATVPAGALLRAQQPQPGETASVTTKLFTSDLGFSYSYPSDWQVVDTVPILPKAHADAEAKQDNDQGKRAAACTQVGFLIRKSQPVSTVMAVMLPYDCYGSTFTDSDLVSFGNGIIQGLGGNFDFGTTLKVTYRLGSHNLWGARMHGTQKGHPETAYAFEAACTLLKKGAVCWIVMSQDEQILKVLEQGQVALEGDPLTPLVPLGTFDAAK